MADFAHVDHAVCRVPCADCPFCSLPLARIVDSDTMAVAVHDAFPVAPGHALVIPLRHVGSFFELQESEQLAMLVLLNRACARLGFEVAPDGYTVGINDGHAAGQTVPHVHLHLIPRHAGDVPDPGGGVRWVIPDNWIPAGAVRLVLPARLEIPRRGAPGEQGRRAQAGIRDEGRCAVRTD